MFPVLIVGQAPSRNSDPSEPLSGCSGRRLAALCGMDLAEFLAAFERVNLLGRFPGKSTGKGDAFPLDRARRAAGRVGPTFHGYEVVLLGKNVQAAFSVADVPILRWLPAPGFRFAVCPHPSGVCYWWNDPANVRRARRFWRALAFPS